MKKIILLTTVFFYCLKVSYAQPGELDSSFGTNGTVAIPFNTGSYTPIAIQADGKIIIGGANLARYNMDGSPDTTFAGGIFHTSDNFPIGALAIQADEKIVVATEASINNNFGGTVNLYRYNKDGSADITFDGDGMKTTTLSWGSPEDLVNDISIVIQSDNKIIVAASGIERFNADGSLDKSFGPDFYIGSAAIQKDGKIVVAGFSYETEVYNINFAVARYNVDGTPDLSFSNDGLQTVDFKPNDFGNSIVIQDDGKIIVTGHADNYGSETQLAIARLNI